MAEEKLIFKKSVIFDTGTILDLSKTTVKIADSTLVGYAKDSDLQNEISRSTDEDASLRQAITNEITRATGAEQALQSGLETQGQLITTSVASLRSSINTKANASDLEELSAEVTNNSEKLGAIDDGAQVNKIETIKINGAVVSINVDKSVDLGYTKKRSIDARRSGLETVETLHYIFGNAGDLKKLDNIQSVIKLDEDLLEQKTKLLLEFDSPTGDHQDYFINIGYGIKLDDICELKSGSTDNDVNSLKLNIDESYKDKQILVDISGCLITICCSASIGD